MRSVARRRRSCEPRRRRRACLPDRDSSDGVARFHLDNGARLERVNVNADLSQKGLRESFGVMVNYLYDLGAVEANHERFIRAEAVYSSQIAALV
jgi:malonyl-CoA decarboxylase